MAMENPGSGPPVKWMAKNIADPWSVIRRCVVISISKASDKESVIYVLKSGREGLEGHPLQLYQPNGIAYIWPNIKIAKENISCRSALKYYPFGDIVIYRGNTNKEKVGLIHVCPNKP